MIPQDVRSVMELLKVLAETERAIADFYDACGRMWHEEGAFWDRLVQDEKKHAECMQRMSTIIFQKQHLFAIGRQISPVAARTFIRGIEENKERCLRGVLSHKQMLFIARDIERSIIEDKFYEVVTTDDLEYNTLAKAIMVETIEHNTLIDDKIKGNDS